MAAITTMAAPAALAAHPYWGHGGGGGWWFFPLIPLLFFGFWIVLFLGVIRPLIWRRRGWGGGGPWGGPGGPGGYGWYGGPGHPGAAGSAEAVLAERFARGEVDEAEYRARLEVLRAPRT